MQRSTTRLLPNLSTEYAWQVREYLLLKARLGTETSGSYFDTYHLLKPMSPSPPWQPPVTTARLEEHSKDQSLNLLGLQVLLCCTKDLLSDACWSNLSINRGVVGICGGCVSRMYVLQWFIENEWRPSVFLCALLAAMHHYCFEMSEKNKNLALKCWLTWYVCVCVVGKKLFTWVGFDHSS